MSVHERPYVAERFRAQREALVAEVEFLLRSGERREAIPGRLGYSNPESLERRLHRAGRHDLAAALHVNTEQRQQYERVLRERRRRPCAAGCGGTCSGKSKYEICRPCLDRLGIARILGATGSLDAALTMSLRAAS